MSRRLTRKEIKRDEVAETVVSAVDYLRDHARKIVWLLALVAGGAVVAALVFAHLQRRERQAAEALAKAVDVYEAPIVATGAKPDDPLEPSFASEAARSARARGLLEEVRERFGGTDAADLALVYLAELTARQGELTAARDLWQQFVDAHKDHLLAAEVKLNLIAADRALGRGEEVAERLRGALDGGQGSPLPQDVLLYELARTLEQLGRDDEAREAYRRIVDEFPSSAYLGEAQQRSQVPGEEMPGAASS